MPDLDLAAVEAALADLRRKLSKRENQPGYARNAEALRARISELENERTVLLGEG